MINFIGYPINFAIDYCKKNNIEYIIKLNSFSQEENMKLFVTDMRMKNNRMEIVVSKFKIEV